MAACFAATWTVLSAVADFWWLSLLLLLFLTRWPPGLPVFTALSTWLEAPFSTLARGRGSVKLSAVTNNFDNAQKRVGPFQ